MHPPTKADWRTKILDGRRTLSTERRRSENAALATLAATLVPADTTVCAYVPVGSEPGAISMLDALADAGAEVLVPITRPDTSLCWAHFLGADTLVAAGFGLHEPTGAVLPPETVGRAHTVLVPALAVDRRGVRLGRGAGFYDRTLHLAAPDARIVAVVRDDELVDELPEDPHDIRMGWALTPGSGLVRLGSDEGAEQHRP
ncbi:5-formyltetrahydrofolate cyclo-ligase [Rhodococcus artemisiae]|uniref:5-formyltetrahydrofolate cyclo-ligase n=1 Tax=Rhodococcus artemisiae TaxID=714159 RepID=A0ABU7LFQ1_9NOCA|nr:5-formyltetrahydrofolate cyclo-ligase [Rhodococcus artemisiae]MEE2059757.1 5-formyltetrahydrofolate cyclo-ligase [Rhodococcus artemisiae]